MSIQTRNRVDKGVTTGGQFAKEHKSEDGAVSLNERPRIVTLKDARITGLRARYPSATYLEIAYASSSLTKAKSEGDGAVLAEIELQAARGHGERFAWDVKRSVVDEDSPMSNSYPQDVDPATRNAVEASGADFPNSFRNHDGVLTINTHASGQVEASADDDGRLLIRRVGDSEWQGAAEGQTDTDLWNRNRATQVDFTAVDRALGNYAKRGDLEGKLNEETGEAHYKWTNGFDEVSFKSSAGAPLSIDPETTDEARTAFVSDFTTPHGGEPMERIEKSAVTAREMMIWHPDTESSRFKHRDGAIRDKHEARRHKDRLTGKIESELPGADVTSGQGAAMVYADTADWNARAWVSASGTAVFTVDGRQVDGPDPSKRKQVRLAEVMRNNHEELHQLAIASRYSLDR